MSSPRPRSAEERHSLPRRSHLNTSLLTIVVLAIYGWSTVVVKQSSLSVLKQFHKIAAPSDDESNFLMNKVRHGTCERLRDRKLRTVWTLPTQPPANIPHKCTEVEEIVICAYSPCFQAYINAPDIDVEAINLRSLSAGTALENFVNDHMFYKITQGTDYVYHVQFVAMLLLANKTDGKVCVRSLGDDLDMLICKEDVSFWSQKYLSQLRSSSPQFFKERNASILFTEFPEKFTVLDYEDHRNRSNANTGDDLQVLPGVQFMPYVNGFVSRASGVPDAKGHIILNAWWGSKVKFPPNLDNVLVTLFSMHMSGKMKTITMPIVKQWFVDYSRKNGPIGARDSETLEFLRQTGIASYMSSCFTLMLNLGQRDKEHPRDKIVLADPAFRKGYSPQQLRNDTRIVMVTPNLPRRKNTSRNERFFYVESLLKVHATRAKVIITSRIHVALPAAAQGVPVIFVNPASDKRLPGGAGGRTSGVSNLFHEFWADGRQEWDFDLDNMPPNPGVHQIDRYRASFWHYLRKRGPQVYQESATFYGVIPLQRLGAGVNFEPELVHDLFHFVLTQSSDSISWRDIRSIEYVFYHHPNARVYVHSNSITPVGSEFDIFRESGYDLVVQPYDFEQLLASVAAGDLGVIGRDPMHPLHNILMRHLLLHNYGGVGLDFGLYMIKPMPKSMHNFFSALNAKVGLTEGKEVVLSFEKGSSATEAFVSHIRDSLSNVSQSAVGTIIPSNLSDNTGESRMKQYWIRDTLLSISIDSTVECSHRNSSLISKTVTNKNYVLHMNFQEMIQLPLSKTGSSCDLMSLYCIFCDVIPDLQ